MGLLDDSSAKASKKVGVGGNLLEPEVIPFFLMCPELYCGGNRFTQSLFVAIKSS